MILGVIGDDFTGSSDIANTLAQGGMTTALYPGVPDAQADPAIDAGVVALKIRTAPVQQAISQALRALEWLRAQGAVQVVYKICSTFDSTNAGNIGPVAEALAAALAAGVAPVCPAFPGAARRVYMGHLFVHDRLLSETGMADHPLTPMTDPDLRRVLTRQSRGGVGWVGLDDVRGTRLRDALDAEAAAGRRLVICDAIADADLRAIGAASDGLALLVGGSGIALGLPRVHLGDRRMAFPEWQGVPGPVAALAGSVSEATRAQVAAHEAAGHPIRRLDAAAVMDGRETAAELAGWCRAQEPAVPLVTTAQVPKAIAEAQERFGSAALATAIERLMAATARELVQQGTRRLVCAGGETSGAITEALAPGALTLGLEIDPGVPALLADDLGIALALKSGNFGATDFFAKAATILEGKR